MEYHCNKHGIYQDRSATWKDGCPSCVIDAKRIVLDSAVGHVRISMVKFWDEPTHGNAHELVRDLRRALRAEDL